MKNNDDQIWAAIIGGIIGAGLVAPKPEERAELQEYRNLKDLLIIRKQKIGNLPEINKLQQNQVIYNNITEAISMYAYGFFRAASVSCAVILEYVLKNKYDKRNFSSLIEKAKTDGLITESEKNYLHGIRSDRNDFVHEITKETREQDCLIIIQLTVKILDKIM